MAQILLVDDEPLVRKTIRTMLKGAGHDVIEAGDGNEASKIFRERNPDLIIIDLIMRDKDGLTTIIEMLDLRPDTKIIAISGGLRADGSSFLEYAESIGANMVLAKPFTSSELLEAIDECLGSDLKAIDS